MDTENEVEVSPIIKGATIVGGKLKYSYKIPMGEGEDKVNRTGAGTVHEDLVMTFRRLDEHLAALSFQPNKMEVEGEVVNPCTTTGFKLKGPDEDQSIIIIGTRLLPNAKSIKIETPEQKYSGDIFEYEHTPKLLDVITDCIHEVEEYLKGKHAPAVVQLDMFESDDDNSLDEVFKD